MYGPVYHDTHTRLVLDSLLETGCGIQPHHATQVLLVHGDTDSIPWVSDIPQPMVTVPPFLNPRSVSHHSWAQGQCITQFLTPRSI